MSELLPCPFCGRDPELVDMAGWEIVCCCGVDMCLAEPDKEPLIAAWNTRETMTAGQQGAALSDPVACAWRHATPYGHGYALMHGQLLTVWDSPRSPQPAVSVSEDAMSLLCNAFDNLNDIPISDEWAQDWCGRAYHLITAALGEGT